MIKNKLVKYSINNIRIHLEVFGVFSELFFHPNSRIARYTPLSAERKSLENTLKNFTKLFFNHY